MFGISQAEKLVKVAIEDARSCFNDLPEPAELSPSKYDGDGEAFAFSWATELTDIQDRLDKDIARTFYLAIFWNEIERLQSAL